jgi:SAM-dependent methyltransferase
MKRVREESDRDKETPSGDPSKATIEYDTSISEYTESNRYERNSEEGHRYGNFYNYYTFHPVSNRTKHLEEILVYMVHEWNGVNQFCQKQAFRYTDIGCNEGNLTIELAKLLSGQFSKQIRSFEEKGTDMSTAEKSYPTISCTGFDFDPELIRRAQLKTLQQSEQLAKIQIQFQVLDVLKDDIIQKCCDLQFTNFPAQYCTDLTTLFSTTMWIHIHGGDDGLRRVLQQICACTRYWILLEPQPSKCYGTAAFRLRRLGLQPFDVSNERLRLRASVEEEIEYILLEFNFERVHSNGKLRNYDQKDLDGCNKVQTGTETRTQWNRTLRLYQRVTTISGKFSKPK